MTTPAVAYLTRFYHADAGVVISASHNPMEFNGIKFFNSEGYKLSDELEDEIEALICDDLTTVERAIGSHIGHVKYNMEAKEDYIDFIKSTVPLKLNGMKIVIDCAEGASYYTAVKILEDMGAEVYPIHNHPDGTNINDKCGSTHMEELQEAVVKKQADLGLAFDGDADRMLAVDENGKSLCGDEIMAICGNFMMQQGTLKNNKLIVTVMSNLGLVLMIREK